MRLDSIKQDRDIQSSVSEGYDYSIDTSQIALLYEVLSKYSNPVGSLVREITTNAFDSHIEAGVHEKVTVRIDEGDSLAGRDREFQVQDYGVGLSPDRIQNVYRKFLASTKREDNTEHGAWGLGSKSPFSYTNMFTVTTVFDGIEYEYVLHKGNKLPRIDKLSEQPTDKGNGTIVNVPIKIGDVYKFRSEIKRQLAYFDNIEHINTRVDNDYQIFQGDHFLFRPDLDKDSFRNIHIALGKVFYPIDQSMVKLPSESITIDCPIALHFNIGDIPVTFTRESIEYTDEAIEAIEHKYLLAKEELEEYYEKSLGSIDTLEDYLWARRHKKEPVLEIAEGVYIPNINSVIKHKLNYPKYEAIPKLPSLQDTVSIVYKGYKSVNNGVTKSENFNRIGAVITSTDDSKRPYQFKNFYYLEGSYSTLINKYLYEVEGKHRFYLVRKKTKSEKMTESSILAIFGFKDKYDFSELTDEELKAIRGYTKECIEYFKKDFIYYDDIEVPQNFKDAKKGSSKKGMFDPASDEYDPSLKIHVKEVEAFLPNYGSPDINFRVWEPRIDKLLSLRSSLIIYGFQEDSELLEEVGFLLSSFYPRWWGYDIPDKHKLNLLKIAKNKEEALTELTDKPIHVSHFINKRHKVLVRALTNYYVVKVLDTETTMPIQATKYTDSLVLLEQLQLEEFKNVYKEAYRSIQFIKNTSQSDRIDQYLGKRFKAMLDHPLFLEEHTIRKYEECQRYFKKYPLIYQMFANMPSNNSFRDTIEKELTYYVKGKSPINPNLEARLQQYKLNSK